MAAAVPVMADPAEFCRLAANVVLVAVLIMMIVWWRRPNRPSSPTSSASSVGGSAAFETRAKELEAAGDLDGAMRTLLAFWTEKGSSTAMMLAHELSQRHPAEAFEKGCCCPLQQEGGRPVLDFAASASAASAPCPATDAADADTAAGTGTATAPPAAAVPGAAVCTGSVLADAGDANGCPNALAEKVTGEDDKDRGGSPFAVQDTPAIARTHDDGDDSSGGSDRKREAKALAAVAVAEALLGSSDGDGETTKTTKTIETATSKATAATATLPWERGWQGPEGFKPPSTATASSSSVSNEIGTAGGAGSTGAVAVEPASSSGNSVSAAAGGGGGLAGENAIMRRNFTVLQLNTFDGSAPAPKVRGGEIKEGKARPIYIALRGEVYDASAGRSLYGPGGEYSEFAGHDISRRVARGVSRSSGDVSNTNGSSALLDDLSLEGLDRFEKMTLRGWEDTFKARGYPRLGRVVAPPPPRLFSRSELRAFDGRPAALAVAEEGREERGDRDVGGEGLGGRASEGAGAAGGGKARDQTVDSRQGTISSLPANYAAQPIYVGVKDKVFDVSFGGSEFYLEGGAYQCLAGRDASRVLAKMSMTPQDIEGVLDYACLTSREEKNLGDWVEKLGSGGKGYPVVGWIDIGL